MVPPILYMETKFRSSRGGGGKRKKKLKFNEKKIFKKNGETPFSPKKKKKF